MSRPIWSELLSGSRCEPAVFQRGSQMLLLRAVDLAPVDGHLGERDAVALRNVQQLDIESPVRDGRIMAAADCIRTSVQCAGRRSSGRRTGA